MACALESCNSDHEKQLERQLQLIRSQLADTESAVESLRGHVDDLKSAADVLESSDASEVEDAVGDVVAAATEVDTATDSVASAVADASSAAH